MHLHRWLTLVLLLGTAFAASAQDAPPLPVLAILASAPDTPGARQMLSYADYQALTGGAADEQSWIDSLSSNLYSGPTLDYFADRVRDQEALIGVPLFDVAQAATWGQPPQHTTLFQGDFDSEAVAAAYAAREYSANPMGELILYCGPDGCDSGNTVQLDARNPGDPFGGELGAQRPVLFIPREDVAQLASSPNLPTLEEDASAATGTSPSLADSPDYQAAVRALTDASTLLQAYFLSPQAVGPSSDGSELPVYSLLVLAETETDEGSNASVTLVFPSLADAEASIPILESRMKSLVSDVTGESFAATLKNRGVLLNTSAFEDAETGLGVAQIDLQTPNDEQSSYRLLVNSLNRRDLGWLALP